MVGFMGLRADMGIGKKKVIICPAQSSTSFAPPVVINYLTEL
jgi:hypothetical protein